jgi:hypothetical protein
MITDTIPIINLTELSDSTADAYSIQFPTFKDMPAREFESYLSTKINNEHVIEKCNFYGKIMISFRVRYNGEVSNIVITGEDANIYCINEIEKIVKRSQIYWKGGSKFGRPITVQYSIPITIRYR